MELNNIQGPHLTSFLSTHQEKIIAQEFCSENSVSCMFFFLFFLPYLVIYLFTF